VGKVGSVKYNDELDEEKTKDGTPILAQEKYGLERI